MNATVSQFEAVVGLEVHAQLETRTKLFCGCPTDFGAPPNERTCPVCLGHPGALPVPNQAAIELAVRAALALGARVSLASRFARKNYFYPDLPKGYQVTQHEEPLASGGAVAVERAGRTRTIPLTRLHLEEDAGKLIHDEATEPGASSYVDLNRAGVPLVEIVSEPAIESPEEAYLYLERLRSILRYTGVCDGNMEQGSLRCDANVSVRPIGSAELGIRTELKNLNSFRNVERALTYEIARQTDCLGRGGRVEQETRLWDERASVTRPMRGKEIARDYRYFPDPDLPPIVLDPAWVEERRSRLPEPPGARKGRLIEQHGLSDYEAHLLTLERELADYFEEVARLSGNSEASANFVLNDLLREQRRTKRRDSEIPLSAENLAELIRAVDAGTVSLTVARQQLFEPMYESGRTPGELIRSLGVEQLDDEKALVELVRQVLAAHPRQVEEYRAGKSAVLGFLVGQGMRRSGGRANPRKLKQLLERAIR